MLLKFLINTIAIIIAVYILPGVTATSFAAILVFSIVLGIINMFIKPLIVLLTLPINILTLGLFILVINALLVLLASIIVPGFHIAGFWQAILFSVVVSIISFFLSRLIK
jgi:putative membrane protein